MKAEEIHGVLAQQGIRLFALSLGSDRMTYIHANKTVREWREDVRRFISEIKHRRDRGGRAEDEVYNEMTTKLHEAGYVEVNDVVADVYEGRIASYSAGIEDDPAHEEQADGFGHYGWESKSEKAAAEGRYLSGQERHDCPSSITGLPKQMSPRH